MSIIAPQRPDGVAMSPQSAAIEAIDIAKRYEKRTVLDAVSLRVDGGELVVLLGPNGAGKTTLLEVITGLRKPSAGKVRVLATDPRRGGTTLRLKVGVMLQTAGLEPDLKVAECLRHLAGLYPNPQDPSELIHVLGLGASAAVPVRHLSGGQKRRLELGAALVGNPDVLILDEPTTGIDPESRNVIWQTIVAARQRGAAVVMSTHMVSEAAALCDRAIILVEGRILADGSPAELIKDRPSVLEFECEPIQRSLSPAVLASAAAVAQRLDGSWRLEAGRPEDSLKSLLQWADQSSVRLNGLRVAPPSLEDRYLSMIAEQAAH